MSRPWIATAVACVCGQEERLVKNPGMTDQGDRNTQATQSDTLLHFDRLQAFTVFFHS